MSNLEHQYKGFVYSKSIDISEICSFDLDDLPINKTITPDQLEVNTQTLGKRCEVFFEHLLKSSDRYSILAKNIQIQGANNTIGEIDFIIFDTQNKETIHLEMTTKFYLYQPNTNSNELEKWVGPNIKDSLDLKVKKLIQKQFPLLQYPETQIALKQLQINTTSLSQQLCFKAFLFVPYCMPKALYPKINNDCIIGSWMKFETFSVDKFSDYEFHIPEKADWIVDPKHCDNWLKYDQIVPIIQSLLEVKKAPLCWFKSATGVLERNFIVWW